MSNEYQENSVRIHFCKNQRTTKILNYCGKSLQKETCKRVSLSCKYVLCTQCMFSRDGISVRLFDKEF